MYDFTEEELLRYSRHILLKDVGVEGQEKIRNGKVLVVGAGGLGAPVALYLAAAGVGTIGIMDGDVVDLSNLQRQVIHFTGDVGHPKVESARDKMLAINPNVKVNTIREFLMAVNALDIIKAAITPRTAKTAVTFIINFLPFQALPSSSFQSMSETSSVAVALALLFFSLSISLRISFISFLSILFSPYFIVLMSEAITASIYTDVDIVESVVPRFHWLLPFCGTIIFAPPTISFALAFLPSSLICPLG